jgi:hypothetical protein
LTPARGKRVRQATALMHKKKTVFPQAALLPVREHVFFFL